MNRQNTAYRFANFFSLGILKENKDGRSGVQVQVLYIFLAYFMFLELLSGDALFLTEDLSNLSILTHNCSVAHAGFARGASRD